MHIRSVYLVNCHLSIHIHFQNFIVIAAERSEAAHYS